MAIACPNSIARPVAGPGCRRGVARAPAESSGAAATAHDGGHGGGEQDDCRNRRTDLHSPEGSYGRLITRAVPRVALDCLAVDSGKLLHGPGLDFGWCTIPDMAQSASTAAAWLPACGHRTCWWESRARRTSSHCRVASGASSAEGALQAPTVAPGTAGTPTFEFEGIQVSRNLQLSERFCDLAYARQGLCPTVRVSLYDQV
jgi:hypothetical protein